MEDFIAAAPPEYAAQLYYHVLDGLEFQATLTAFLEEQEIDLVAMVTHKRNFLEELFHYSKTKAMSYHSRTPVLSFPLGE
jgi:nucleotide-binding universal stress UspA family protein